MFFYYFVLCVFLLFFCLFFVLFFVLFCFLFCFVFLVPPSVQAPLGSSSALEPAWDSATLSLGGGSGTRSGSGKGTRALAFGGERRGKLELERRSKFIQKGQKKTDV